jgi:hypothetical protein
LENKVSSTVILFDPTAAGASAAAAKAAATSGAPAARASVQQILPALAGMVVGFIDNAKPNFRFLADELSELLTSKYGVARVDRHQKRAASIAAPKDVLERFAKECDIVICGSGD